MLPCFCSVVENAWWPLIELRALASFNSLLLNTVFNHLSLPILYSVLITFCGDELFFQFCEIKCFGAERYIVFLFRGKVPAEKIMKNKSKTTNGSSRQRELTRHSPVTGPRSALTDCRLVDEICWWNYNIANYNTCIVHKVVHKDFILTVQRFTQI